MILRHRLTRFAVSNNVVIATVLALWATTAAQADQRVIRVQGPYVAGLEPLDDLMVSFLRKQRIPGGALAVARNGKLLYARGFGWADVERKEPVQPRSLLRIASVSKPITSMAIQRLVAQQKLTLEDRVESLLGNQYGP